MKQLMITFLLLSGLIMQQGYAVHPATPAAATDVTAIASKLTVDDFLSMDLKSYRNAEGKKLSWPQRIVLKGAQKNFAKQIKKGKLEGTDNFQQAAAEINRANRTGRMSLIFSAVGLALLFIPYISIVGFGLSIAGFILGLIGLKKDEDPTMAIIGTVLGGIVLLLFLVAIAFLASWGGWM